MWVDDFGWWGGFFTDLIDYTHGERELLYPFDHANLLKQTENCYSMMLKNLDIDHGGLWNTPDLNDPACEKNTITNSWMLNLATDLCFLTGNKQIKQRYKDAAAAQYTWLETGKYKTYAPTKWQLYNSDGMLLWAAHGPYTKHPFTNDPFWSGDVGVFLRGVQSYISLIDDAPTRAAMKNSCNVLMTKAIKTPVDKDHMIFVDNDHIMHESPNPPSWYQSDFATGKGVFMRLVTRFAHVNKFVNDDFRYFVDATARSVWCSRVQGDKDHPENRIKPNWNPGFGPSQETEQEKLYMNADIWPQVFQTNGLDALNAAVQISLK